MSYPFPLEISEYFNKLTRNRPQLLLGESSQSVIHQASIGASSVNHLYYVLLIALEYEVVLPPFNTVLPYGKFKGESVDEFEGGATPFKLGTDSFFAFE